MTRIVAGIALALVAILVVAVVNPGIYEVTNKGRLFSYSTGDVYEVRVLDSFDLYVDAESADPPRIDVVNSVLLAATSGAALIVALLGAGEDAALADRIARFFPVLALGAGYLAFDDMAGFHESLGHNLRFLADIPGVHQPDDLILVAYGLPVLGLGLYFREVLAGSRASSLLFGLWVAAAGSAVLLDVVADVRLEELLEPLSSLFLLGATVASARAYVRLEPAIRRRA